LARTGVDALNPQTAKLTLFGAAIAVSILQSLLDALDSDAEAGGGTTAVTAGHIQDFFVTGVGGRTAFDSSHFPVP
jgi:hypothetical protein